jgi:hypothetical protein
MKTIFQSFQTPSAQCFACLILVSLLFSTPLWAQAPAKQWDKRYGGDNDETMYGMIATPDGGYLLAGHTDSPISGDISQATPIANSTLDAWVIKLSSNGTKQWDRRWGGWDLEIISTIVATADGGYLIGGYTRSSANGDITEASRGGSDYWVIKIDSQGTKLWDRSYGGASEDYLSSIVATPDGGFLLGGTSSSGISGEKTQASRGGTDYWVIKINS